MKNKRITWTQDDLQEFTHAFNCMGVRLGAFADMKALQRKFSEQAINEMAAGYRKNAAKGESACQCPHCRPKAT